MARFEIDFSKTAAKDYKKLPKEYKVLIDLVLSKLPNGFPADISADYMLIMLATSRNNTVVEFASSLSNVKG